MKTKLWKRSVALLLCAIMLLSCAGITAKTIVASANEGEELLEKEQSQILDDSDTEYICGLEEHEHGEQCYFYETVQICDYIPSGFEEIALESENALPDSEDVEDEKPSDEANSANTSAEHEHDESCYETVRTLICEIPEHIHDDSCVKQSAVEEGAEESDNVIESFEEDEENSDNTSENEESNETLGTEEPWVMPEDRDKLDIIQPMPEGDDVLVYEKIKAQADDAIGYVQTMEGALSEMHSALQRMDELLIQYQNGTNVDVDKNSLYKELQQLYQEMYRLIAYTHYNDWYGLYGGTVVFELGWGEFVENLPTEITLPSLYEIVAPLTDADSAENADNIVKELLTQVSAIRSYLGAKQNAAEHISDWAKNLSEQYAETGADVGRTNDLGDSTYRFPEIDKRKVFGSSLDNTLRYIEMVQVAEGTQYEMHSILQRENELAVKMANMAGNEADYASILREIAALQDAIAYISTATSYDGFHMLLQTGGIETPVGWSDLCHTLMTVETKDLTKTGVSVSWDDIDELATQMFLEQELGNERATALAMHKQAISEIDNIALLRASYGAQQNGAEHVANLCETVLAFGPTTGNEFDIDEETGHHVLIELDDAIGAEIADMAARKAELEMQMQNDTNTEQDKLSIKMEIDVLTDIIDVMVDLLSVRTGGGADVKTSDSDWSDKAVLEGGESEYTYNLVYTSDRSETTNVCLVDYLESGDNSCWAGTVHSIDLSDADEKGVTVDVYAMLGGISQPNIALMSLEEDDESDVPTALEDLTDGSWTEIDLDSFADYNSIYALAFYFGDTVFGPEQGQTESVSIQVNMTTAEGGKQNSVWVPLDEDNSYELENYIEVYELTADHADVQHYMPEDGATVVMLFEEDEDTVPGITKQVWNSSYGDVSEHYFDHGSGWGSTNSAKRGDEVWFRTIITNAAGVQNLVLRDFMSDGLSFYTERDTDVAEEMVDYSKNNIIPQTESTTSENTGKIESSFKIDRVTYAPPAVEVYKGSEVLPETAYTIKVGKDGSYFDVIFENGVGESLSENERLTVVYSAYLNSYAVVSPYSNDNTAFLGYGSGKYGLPEAYSGSLSASSSTNGVLSILGGMSLLRAADNLLAQSGQSMLAQTNQSSDGVLSLLGDSSDSSEPSGNSNSLAQASSSMLTGNEQNGAGEDAGETGFRGIAGPAKTSTYIHELTYQIWQDNANAPSGDRNGSDWMADLNSPKWAGYADAPIGSNLYYRIAFTTGALRYSGLQQAGQSMLPQPGNTTSAESQIRDTDMADEQTSQGVLELIGSDDDSSEGETGFSDTSSSGRSTEKLSSGYKPRNLVLKVLLERITVDYDSLEVWKNGTEKLTPGVDYRLYTQEYYNYSNDFDPNNAKAVSELMAIKGRLEYTVHPYYTFGLIFSNDLFYENWSENDMIIVTYKAKQDDDAYLAGDDAAGHAINAKGFACRFVDQTSTVKLGAAAMERDEFDALISSSDNSSLPRFAGTEKVDVAAIENGTAEYPTNVSASVFAESEAVVMNYGFDLAKTDGYDTFLEGAKFELRKDAEDPTSAIELVKIDGMSSGSNLNEEIHPCGGPLYRIALPGDKNTTTEIEAGLATIVGLDSGIYYVVETEAPEGYQLSESAYLVELLSFAERANSMSLTSYDDVPRFNALRAAWANVIPIRTYQVDALSLMETTVSANAFFTANKDEDGNILSYTYGNDEVIIEGASYLGNTSVSTSRGGVHVTNYTGKEIFAPIVNKQVWLGKDAPTDYFSESGWGTTNTARIGDTVWYRATITAAADAENYVFFDRIYPGLVFTGEPIFEVYKNGELLTPAVEEDTDEILDDENNENSDEESEEISDGDFVGNYRLYIDEDWYDIVEEFDDRDTDMDDSDNEMVSYDDQISSHVVVQHNMTAMATQKAAFTVKFSDSLCDSLEEGDVLTLVYCAKVSENAQAGAEGNPSIAMLGYGKAGTTSTLAQANQSHQDVLQMLQSDDIPIENDSDDEWFIGDDDGIAAMDDKIEVDDENYGIDPQMVVQHNITAVNSHDKLASTTLNRIMCSYGTTSASKIVTTYTYEMDIVTIDGDNNNVLDGAKLRIIDSSTNDVIKLVPYDPVKFSWKYWSLAALSTSTPQGVLSILQDGGDILVETEWDSDSLIQAYRPALSGEEDIAITEVPAGMLSFVGFGDGKYQIEEVASPENYHKLTRPIELEVISQIKEDSEDELSGIALVSIDGSEDLIPMSFGDNSLTSDGVSLVFTEGQGIPVINYTGLEMPETGGDGTLPMYIVAFLMIVLSVPMITEGTRKKKEREKKQGSE